MGIINPEQQTQQNLNTVLKNINIAYIFQIKKFWGLVEFAREDYVSIKKSIPNFINWLKGILKLVRGSIIYYVRLSLKSKLIFKISVFVALNYYIFFYILQKVLLILFLIPKISLIFFFDWKNNNDKKAQRK